VPEYVPYVPHVRDLAWQDLYRKFHGQIDEQFGFLAFRSAPLVSASTMDAKVASADMAQGLMVWAAIGKPNQREWEPSSWQRQSYAKNDGLYPSGYHLFRAEPSESLHSAIQDSEKARVAAKPPAHQPDNKPAEKVSTDRLWKGWILPSTEADVWLAAGAAAYYEDLQSDHLDQAMNVRRATYRRLKLTAADPQQRFFLERTKGALFLDSLRRRMGDDPFLQLMREYFAANTTRTVTAQSFLEKAGAPFAVDVEEGAAYLTTDIWPRLRSAILVYGTLRDAGANRYAAEQMQKQFLDSYESEVPIRKDFEVEDQDLRAHDVVFIGRPEANSALAAWSKSLGLDYDEGVFRINGDAHASERDALAFAGRNPLDPTHMVLVVAGNDALRTVKLAAGIGEWKSGEYLLVDDGKEPVAGFVKPAK